MVGGQPLKVPPVRFTGESTRAKKAKHNKQMASRSSPCIGQLSEASHAHSTAGQSSELRVQPGCTHQSAPAFTFAAFHLCF